MEILETLGVDISKKVIDTHLHKENLFQQFENNKKGFKQMVKWLEKSSKVPTENLLFAMEHTGIYCHSISLFLFEENFNYVILPGLEIKQSMGMTRGKNDKADAKRIALYSYEKRDRLKSNIPSSESIVKLKRLFSLRERMVKQRAGYKMSLKEQSEILSKSKNKLLLKKYNVDSEEVKQYFEMDNVIDGFFTISQILFGIEYRELDDPSVWHNDVRMFEMLDQSTGRKIVKCSADEYGQNSVATLDGGVAVGATTIDVQTGEGASFNENDIIWFVTGDGQKYKISSISTDTLTIVRYPAVNSTGLTEAAVDTTAIHRR